MRQRIGPRAEVFAKRQLEADAVGANDLLFHGVQKVLAVRVVQRELPSTAAQIAQSHADFLIGRERGHHPVFRKTVDLGSLVGGIKGGEATRRARSAKPRLHRPGQESHLTFPRKQRKPDNGRAEGDIGGRRKKHMNAMEDKDDASDQQSVFMVEILELG